MASSAKEKRLKELEADIDMLFRCKEMCSPVSERKDASGKASALDGNVLRTACVLQEVAKGIEATILERCQQLHALKVCP